MTLKELNVGDRFYPKSKADKATPIFEVVDKVQGMSGKIKCLNLKNGKFEMKIANQEVIKHS